MIHAAQGKTGLSELDPHSRAVLMFVAKAEVQGDRITMSSLLQSNQFGSYPTMLRRVQMLVQDGWLLVESDPEDARHKTVRLSEAGAKAFNAMSAGLDKFIGNLPERSGKI